METKDILKKLRESKQKTIQEVATAIGMKYSVCREYESGDRNLGMSAAIKFADFYGVSIDYLLGRDTTPPPDSIQAVVDEKNLEALEEALFRQYMELPETARKKVIEFMYRAADEAAAKKNREQSGSSLTMPFANFDGERIPIRDAARNGEEIGSITLADKMQLDSLPDLPEDM